MQAVAQAHTAPGADGDLYPLVLTVWRENLVGHPDPAFSSYNIIQKGIAEGFRVGNDYSTKPLKSRNHNLL